MSPNLKSKDHNTQLQIVCGNTDCPSTSERLPFVPRPTHTSDSSMSVNFLILRYFNLALVHMNMIAVNHMPEKISLVIWAEVGESQLIGPEIVQETTEKDFQLRKIERQEVAEKALLDKSVNLLKLQVETSDTYGSPWREWYDLVSLDEIEIDENLRFVEEPIEIVERDVKKLKRRRISLVKVRWNSRQGAEYIGNVRPIYEEISDLFLNPYLP
ncbi:hypothetical protein Tco_0606910 [Tanacetum coccineum]